MDSKQVHLALLIWSLIGIPYSGFLFMLTYPNPISTFYLFLSICNIGGLLVLLLGWFHDMAEASPDWNTEGDAPSISRWTLIGLASLFIISLVMSMFLGQITPSMWVPQELYPLAEEPTPQTTLVPYLTNVFSTWFSIVPGEGGLIISFSAFHKAYEHSDIELPFAFQPALMLGRFLWSVEHVIKGQYPMVFSLNVFASGTAMDVSSAQGGTYLTQYLIHALFNTILLTATFLATSKMLTIL